MRRFHGDTSLSQDHSRQTFLFRSAQALLKRQALCQGRSYSSCSNESPCVQGVGIGRGRVERLNEARGTRVKMSDGAVGETICPVRTLPVFSWSTWETFCSAGLSK